MPFGEGDIGGLSTKERNVLDYMGKLVNLTGQCSENRRKRIARTYLWNTINIINIFICLWTMFHFRHNFDIVGYVMHHFALFFDTFLLGLTFSLHHTSVQYVIENSKKTYRYESELVEKYLQSIVKPRIKLTESVGRLVTFLAFGMYFEVMAFLVLEELYFKTYRGIYPIDIGLDLDNQIILLLVIVWQNVISYVTICVVASVPVIGYTGWSHVVLECDIMKFAMEHVDEIVKEQLLKNRIKKKGDIKTRTAQLYETYIYHFAKHHAAIVKYFNEFQNVVRIITFLTFASGFVLFAAVGLSSLSENTGIKLKLTGFLIIQLLVIYGWCWMGQSIYDKSGEITHTASAMPWFKMPRSCHPIIRLIMVGASRPLAMTTRFGPSANHESFMDLMKNTYQFVSVVYQMLND